MYVAKMEYLSSNSFRDGVAFIGNMRKWKPRHFDDYFLKIRLSAPATSLATSNRDPRLSIRDSRCATFSQTPAQTNRQISWHKINIKRRNTKAAKQRDRVSAKQHQPF